MDQMTVNPPDDLARAPFNTKAVACFGCVKPEFDMAWGTSITIIELCSFATWIVEDIDHKPVWSIPRDLYIYLLPW